MARVELSIAAPIRLDDRILTVAVEPLCDGTRYDCPSVRRQAGLDRAIERFDHGLVQSGCHWHTHNLNIP